ncbi:MAG: hypothetical protein LBS25_05545 [Candidatus Symbiothrix sp.]|jgi:hypothetical protein|nr:hypothetical protein [Candidatus Symbiothrix sp.]
MKKIATILFAAGIMTAFTACQQAKKAEEKVETTATEAVEEVKAEVQAAVETPAAEPEIKPADALKAFQAFAKEYAEAYNNIAKNPVKYTQLAGQYRQKIADVEKVKDKFTPAQVKAFEKSLQIIKDVNSGGTKK